MNSNLSSLKPNALWENFENICITSFKVQDQTLAYWINVNFTLTRTGQQLKKSKKLRVQSAV